MDSWVRTKPLNLQQEAEACRRQEPWKRNVNEIIILNYKAF